MDRSSRDDIIREAVLIDPPGGESLRLRFYGPFEGREVLWIATFHALGSDGRGGANFIHVGEETPEGMTLSVGLPVARIDLPTIRNAVIMIRRYKRLRRGRHEW
ncbi:hypothetical protein B1C78_02680 [Thioalkalivibrio denitrificans]|uniref:Uncharacterized protein n=1 Tax=Thioalkalivibrio denitrificans TaxID=108003 RepID=A0A1V3NS24_9GAMM|nr:hypothetical protein B1C78_02680 [Thioalkalivibrio denitrificans]